MKRALVIANNLRQASYRLRVEALLEPLARRGWRWEVRVRPRGLLARRRLLRSAGEHDLVVLQRKLLDPADARLLRRCARRVVLDVDDAVMLHAKEVGRISRWRTTRRFRATIAACDRVVAGSEVLAESFRERGCRVSVVPTTLDPARYRLKEHHATPAPALVWIGSRSTIPYLRRFLPALEESTRRVPGLRLVVIADAGLEAAPLPVENVPWSLDGEAEALLRGDIGIAPTPDDPWARGKCGFKLLQVLAAGLPAIASPVGANASIIRHGEDGLLVPDPAAWPEAIATLSSDPALRSRMGQAGRKRVEEEYCLERAAEAWSKILEELLASRS